MYNLGVKVFINFFIKYINSFFPFSKNYKKLKLKKIKSINNNKK